MIGQLITRSCLYTQYREMDDKYTGFPINMSPVYHAIERHLAVDAQYFLAEPVANIEKGAISDKIELAYRANHTERGDMKDVELNCLVTLSVRFLELRRGENPMEKLWAF